MLKTKTTDWVSWIWKRWKLLRSKQERLSSATHSWKKKAYPLIASIESPPSTDDDRASSSSRSCCGPPSFSGVTHCPSVSLSVCPWLFLSLSTPLRREGFTSFLRDQKKVWWLSHLAQACQQDLHSSWIECDEEHLTCRSVGDSGPQSVAGEAVIRAATGTDKALSKKLYWWAIDHGVGPNPDVLEKSRQERGQEDDVMDKSVSEIFHHFIGRLVFCLLLLELFDSLNIDYYWIVLQEERLHRLNDAHPWIPLFPPSSFSSSSSSSLYSSSSSALQRVVECFLFLNESFHRISLQVLILAFSYSPCLSVDDSRAVTLEDLQKLSSQMLVGFQQALGKAKLLRDCWSMASTLLRVWILIHISELSWRERWNWWWHFIFHILGASFLSSGCGISEAFQR